MAKFNYLALALSCAVLGGCAGGHEDLDTYIADTMARPSGEIEPVPTFRPYKTYKYAASALRSPFEAPQRITAVDSEYGRVAVAPDETRPRELLESFSFAALTMVGILEKDGIIWALIDDGRGGIHRVTTGNYLGKNHGKIVSLSGSQVDVIEIVPDGKNGWVERPRTLALKEIKGE
jgi:type IV pilus assembly protein PilP